MPDRSANLRLFFARYVAALGAVRDPRIEQAFAAVRREPFAGPGPWSICLPNFGYITTPNDDLAFLYQDTLVALDPARGVNIGQPSAHARWLDALGMRPGERVVQIGAGTGYYTSILAHLVGPAGEVHAFEIDEGLAARAATNMRALPQARVHARSGIARDLPKADAVYVCAGITQPSWTWIDALKPNGRLVFPLQQPGALGGMLMIRRPEHGEVWAARFISSASFIACEGPQGEEAGGRLSAAFAKGGASAVQSFRIGRAVGDGCWFAGDGWWLSTAPPHASP